MSETNVISVLLGCLGVLLLFGASSMLAGGTTSTGGKAGRNFTEAVA